MQRDREMARVTYSIPKHINPIRFSRPISESCQLPQKYPDFKLRILRIQASSSKDMFARKKSRTSRRLISIATADGRWHGKWTCDYIFSLEELQLADLAEDGQKEADVFISLTMEKHASFGFSVDGRITTSFKRKCSICSSSYCREINTTFDVWVLSSKRNKKSIQVPDIGGQDPSLKVIYVKPGSEADLDSLIQDTIRLASSTKETCSESCEKSEQKWQYIGSNDASIDERWSRLLKLRDTVI